MASFKHDSINLERPTFRLARLLAGSAIDIHCEILQAWFDQPDDIMPYEALSYTWGSTEKTDKIDINGAEFPVTLNLYLALQYLRLENVDRILWVDGLCINQKNDKEKSHQVQQMGNIYRRAERVVIWLGPATYETNVLMDSMKLLERESINYSRNNSQAWREGWSNIQPKLKDIHSDLEVRQRNGLESLFERPWFSRVWILQEVANARVAVVVCGVKSVSARTFALIPSLIGVNPPPHCQSILDIMPGRSREESWWSQRRDLQTLLQKFSRSAASDPRDNIYALLGLSSDACDNDLLRADYSKPVRTVINDAALFLLRCPELYDTDFLSGYNMPQFLRCVSALGSVALAWAQNTANEPLKSILIARDDLDVNWKDAGGVTLLLTAIRKRDKRTINLLLQRDGIDVNLKDEDGISPLIASVRAQQEDIVKLLLSHHDIDVNSRDTTEKTPLMLATENHEPVVVKSLLGCDGIDVNSKDSNGDTALHLAADFRVSAKNYTSIEFRSKEMAQNTEVARLILGCKDINVGMKNKMEETPLMLAVKNWNMEVVELLDVNSKNKYRRTALLTAVQKSVKSVRVFWRTVIQISGWK